MAHPAFGENPIPPEFAVPLNNELALRGIGLEFHRFNSATGTATAVRFTAGGEVLVAFVVKTVDPVELAQLALDMIRRGEVDW